MNKSEQKLLDDYCDEMDCLQGTFTLQMLIDSHRSFRLAKKLTIDEKLAEDELIYNRTKEIARNEVLNGEYISTEKLRELHDTKKKLSIIRTAWMIANPRKGKRKQSWMELSFSEWLDYRNIEYETEVFFRSEKFNKNYYVDFLFEHKKLIIELDGNQHEKRKTEDVIRDSFFNDIGYTVIRITYKEYISKSKISLIESILI